jgi:cyclic-di-AMP phosphodiesterase PgpH
MAFLDRIGLGRKWRGVGYLSDKRHDDVASMRTHPYMKAAILATFFLVLLVFYPGGYFQQTVHRVGEPWRGEDLIAPFTFSILKSDAEIQAEIDEIVANVLPIFYQQPNAMQTSQTGLDSVYAALTPVLEAYLQYRITARTGNRDLMVADSTQYLSILQRSTLTFDERSWSVLRQNYAALGIAERMNQSTGQRFLGVDVRIRTEFLLDELYADGILDVAKPTLSGPAIVVRNPRDRVQRTVAVAQLRDLPDVRDFAQFRFSRVLSDDAAHVAQQLLDMVVVPNITFNAIETKTRITELTDAISPTKGAVPIGELIIRRGDTITAQTLTMLESLAAAREESVTDVDRWRRMTGNLLVLVSIFLTYLLYLYLYRNPIFDSNPMLLLVLLANALILGTAFLLARTDAVSHYMVPIAIAPIILTIIFDSRVGLMTTTTLALAIGFVNGNDYEFVVAAITAGSIAVYSVRDVKNRNQFFFTTPALVFGSFALVTLGFTLLKTDAWRLWADTLLHAAGGSVLIWLTYPLILLFEKLFKVTTDVTLLELNDHNHPLLRDLMNLAPGTFQHSLQVAGLSEAAASAIGANSLLCRVGALYHDVGKTDRPEYFVENQMGGSNEHDKLKPRMSVLVIKNHVSQGVKLAEAHKLPEIVIDFIRTHHGTSVIRFFHVKAKNQTDDDSEVREEDYRYDGPLPHSKETGILLLADGVEAAARAMSEPTYPKLENLVNRMVDERFAEGQLNNCPLTFQDIRIIKETFRNVLVGVYHQRVKYPGNA